MQQSKRSGFSLVELSIVLVILGLLTGGILSGAYLIRASELRSVMTQYDSLNVAMNAFRNKYTQWPGDFETPGSFWPTVDGAAFPWTVNAGCGGGRGDGKICWGGEGPYAWKQLQLARLVSGTFDATSCNANCVANPGVNIPTSKISGAGWAVAVSSATAALGKNVLMIGASNGADMLPILPIFKGEEALNIDTKMDDGLPETGKVLGWQDVVCKTGNAYNISASGNICTLDFVFR